MKKLILVASIPFLVSACYSPKDGKVSDANEALEIRSGNTDLLNVVQLDVEKSSIKWMGSSVKDEHRGFITLKEGHFLMDGEELKGGKFVLDMTSIKAVLHEKERDSEEKLVKLSANLKGTDFFDASKYAESVFEIAEIKQTEAQDSLLFLGNLTIKGITKSISVPAKITNENGQIKAATNFNIDRTLWGVTYRSDESLKNKMISPFINFTIDLISKN